MADFRLFSVKHCCVSTIFLFSNHTIPARLSFCPWHVLLIHFNMADYKCFECKKEFPSEKSVIDHFKMDHFYKNNAQQMKCAINHAEDKTCGKTYLTFGGLRKHLKMCIKEKRNDDRRYSVQCDAEQEAGQFSEKSADEIDNLSKSFVHDLNIHDEVIIHIHIHCKKF